MAEHFANEYQTALSASIDASQTTLAVDSATGAPTPSFRIRIDDEYMLVTGVAGLTFTVTRGIEESTAASHASDTTVTHVLTAGGLAQKVNEPHGLIVDKGAITLLQRSAATNAEDDHFDNTSIDGKWTTLTGTPNTTTLAGWVYGASTFCLQQPVPSGDWVLETEILVPSQAVAGFPKIGMWLSNSATETGAQRHFFIGGNNSLTANWRIAVENYTNGAFVSALIAAATILPNYDGHFFLRIGRTGTTYYFESSQTGIFWYRFGSTASLGITPTHFGLRAEGGGAYNYLLRR